jgi:thiol:disulfide interchange protein
MPLADAEATRRQPRWLWVTVVLLLVARVASGLYEKDHPSMPRSLVAWVDLDKAPALSRERGLPIFYEFSADWCGPCKLMDRDVFNNDNAAREINARYIPVRITDRMEEDGENLPPVRELIQKYKIMYFPSIVVVPPDGTKARELRGYEGYTETLQFLRIPTPSSG